MSYHKKKSFSSGFFCQYGLHLMFLAVFFVKVAAFKAFVIENYIITCLSPRSKLCCCLIYFCVFPHSCFLIFDLGLVVQRIRASHFG